MQVHSIQMCRGNKSRSHQFC